MYAWPQRPGVEFVTNPLGTFREGTVHQHESAPISLPKVGYARVAAFRPIPAVLQERGVDLGDVLAEAGIRGDIFDDPDNLISYPDVARLVATSARRAN